MFSKFSKAEARNTKIRAILFALARDYSEDRVKSRTTAIEELNISFEEMVEEAKRNIWARRAYVGTPVNFQTGEVGPFAERFLNDRAIRLLKEDAKLNEAGLPALRKEMENPFVKEVMNEFPWSFWSAIQAQMDKSETTSNVHSLLKSAGVDIDLGEPYGFQYPEISEEEVADLLCLELAEEEANWQEPGSVAVA